MAKLDWQKVVKQKTNTDHIQFESKVKNAGYNWNKQSEILYYKANMWPCKGKYEGTPMSKVSLKYLEWVGMNFDAESLGYRVAVAELERRAK